MQVLFIIKILQPPRYTPSIRRRQRQMCIRDSFSTGFCIVPTSTIA
ncbi:hypothetical protein FRIG_15720 [Frigoribacterium faeni]|nr:hypothetical protein [Frigoribacterium faeni]MCJ0702559.1 hypothetical protein [Frigoribacterium faeni]